ncbi:MULTISPECIES: hypothetical protein [Aliivibrio]|uniref:G domain-containing protein n=1 Tax=Aliivibrio finisterrensis TaxID=511998 RepID=A0A4Q5KTC0_9GAMM|nr:MULTISPECIES: hypothetical protein [Aliivibrio]MDD9180013.1 hypothetical protein [Aliivibrio sp. A6]RYU49773.1 hypothetical protein ERW57_14260 [Aliivibrio finisterrensis]RYU51334.1 hypothetical protein ERW56_12860 [Aliivibrio finisterrensis]RYU56395.1 hypothetical protein ERW50_14480 [Aliivibrio finisterrensis]RYU63899.1 hypothetical protein ERW53_11965 [Aliivibrio finisterrensis]
MMGNSYKPEKVYQQIQNIIDELILRLNSTTKDTSIRDANEAGREILDKLHTQVTEQLYCLEENAEWDTFTIAFYGETNAGKSTIIETLRILLKEELKKEQQAKFLKWQLKSGITKECIEKTRLEILEGENRIDEFDMAWREKERALLQAINHRKLETQQAQDRVKLAKESATLFERLIWLFKKIPEFKEYQTSYKLTKEAENDLNTQSKSYIDEKSTLSNALQRLELRNKEIEEKTKAAESFADGAIIGNGRSDFTLETQNYYFDVGGTRFNLLDVPGIEGKESKVSDAIWQAVHKAHAVFYVTGKASAPQKGDGKNPGTLEKIKQHLGAQSEVWTIYNKRIQNPIQLGMGPIISQGEQESLDDLDSKMIDYLGDSYQKHIGLSAYPAFLAASSCLLPGSRDASAQDKFLSKYDKQDILYKSNITALTKMFNESVVNDFKNKIVRSNQNKAKQVVDMALMDVTCLQKEKFGPLLGLLRSELSDTSAELNSHVELLRSRLRNKTKELIYDFSSKVREKTYKDINRDISNDEFQDYLKQNIETYQNELIEEIPNKIKLELTKFEEQIKDVVARFEAQTSEVMTTFNNMDQDDLSLNFKFNNGVNVWGVLGAVGGGALLFFTPVGWGVIAVSVATLVFQFYKAVRSFFSSSYKQSQQRQSTDENIENVAYDIEMNVESNLSQMMKDVEANIESINSTMETSIAHVESVNKKLNLAREELHSICKQLES